MPDDPLRTDPPPEPVPIPPDRRKIVCEFCQCQLTPNGEIVRMGERAKEYRGFDEKLEKLKRDHQNEIDRLTSELAAVKQERDSLKTSQTSSSRVGARVTRRST